MLQLLLVDIDGLRPDVFTGSLGAGKLPNLSRLLGNSELARGLRIPALAPAPSITFVSQACLFTGAHPARHGITGNQFFDRFGLDSNSTPRHFAFDVGDQLAIDDAVRVFTDGLAARSLRTATLYEQIGSRGWRSLVSGHMYARGATKWLSPSLVNLARLTKGGSLFGMPPAEFDRIAINRVMNEVARNGFPDLLTLYFMGVDSESHHKGVQAQAPYLEEVVDPLVGRIWDAVEVEARSGHPLPLCAIFSDHGQISVPADDRHSLRLSFPFEREIGHLFDALGLDVHDYPGEDPNVDAVVSSNGGLALVSLQNRRGHWADAPDFERDVLPVGQAFWEAHATGRRAPELEGSLAGVLLRDTGKDGWYAPYHALTPDGRLVSLVEWFATQPAGLYADPVNRLNNLSGPNSGDMILISDYEAGFYFASPVHGVHGGLHPEDSAATLFYGWPGADERDWQQARQSIEGAIYRRCGAESDRQPSTADLLTGLNAVFEF